MSTLPLPDLWNFLRARTPEALGFKVTENVNFTRFPVPPGVEASDIETKNHIEALEYLDDDGLILDLHSWGTDPRREFTRLVERLSRWRRKNKNIQFVPRNYGHQAPLENGLTLFHGNKRVSQVPLVAAEIGFKDRNGTRISDDWITAAVMDWWNVEEFPTAHTTASHDAFVISRREGLTHITFPAGYAAAVVEAQKHQGDPSYRFPALTVKMDRSRWYRFFEAEEWFIKDGDLEGWKQVLDDRRAFVKLLLRLFHYILAGKASVPGMQDSFAEAV